MHEITNIQPLCKPSDEIQRAPAFDYAELQEDVRVQVRGAAMAIRVGFEGMIANAILIGHQLIKVKNLLGHGHFLKWLDAEFTMSERMARNYMSAATRFKSAPVADLAPSVLFAIAAPSTPEDVVQEVIGRAAAGEPITRDDVARLKRKAKNGSGDYSADGERTASPADIEEGRLISKAETAEPGVVRRHLDEALAAGREPSHELVLSGLQDVVRRTDHVAGDMPSQIPDDVQFGGASRVEPVDSLDFFPTPPQATRALMLHVMPHLGVRGFATVNEPSCGEGHMAEVLREFFGTVHATDIKDYGAGDDVVDFLDPDASAALPAADWFITNPPFKGKVLAFALRSLELARVGVALFVPLRYLEGVGRYEKLYRDNPPTVVCPFVDRVPLHRDRWEPDGDTKTAYCWLVWIKGKPPRPPFWIPPGVMTDLARPDDEERFTTSPVTRKAHNITIAPEIETPAELTAGECTRIIDYCIFGGPEPCAVKDDDGCISPAGEDILAIPNFLQRGTDNVPPFARRAVS